MTLCSSGLRWLAGRFLRSRSGSVPLEYALIAGMLSILILPAVVNIGEALQNMGFDRIAAALQIARSDN